MNDYSNVDLSIVLNFINLKVPKYSALLSTRLVNCYTTATGWALG